ncbi:MAG TPA: M24 family metallopeptidase [Vicinamibacterales bacterium]|nr:M24 family metallopeptidase [Vicinamibacterales bacterium]
MPLPIDAVQQALKEEGFDGWLLYDFHGSNPIATRVAGLASSGKMATRRWYYLIPATGEPRGLVHAIERHNLDGLPGDKRPYAGRHQLDAGLKDLLGGLRRVAMEYSPGNNIPYLSRVDAGTIEAVRQYGVEVASSGDLVQRFEAIWTDEAYRTHVEASERLYRIKDRAFGLVRERMASGAAINEYELQQMMVGWFGEEGLVSSDPPNVSAQENAGNPHYSATGDHHRAIRPNELLLIDLWGKLPAPGAVFADITWVAFTDGQVPDEFARAFAAARDGRDAAVELVRRAVAEGRDLRGWQVDRACRDVIQQAGFGDSFIHRTGHSLGEEVHGNGVHMDDYETHDDRRLIPGTGFTIEPGIYTDRFGVRTEINMFVAEREARVTGPLQQEIVRLG